MEMVKNLAYMVEYRSSIFSKINIIILFMIEEEVFVKIFKLFFFFFFLVKKNIAAMITKLKKNIL